MFCPAESSGLRQLQAAELLGEEGLLDRRRGRRSGRAVPDAAAANIGRALPQRQWVEQHCPRPGVIRIGGPAPWQNGSGWTNTV